MGTFRTSSIFHYTGDLGTLRSILQIGLYPNYCKELFFRNNREEPPYMVGIPMVSFCDVPLSIAAVLQKRYNPYAIGLSKEWGRSKGINPLLYVNNQDIFNSAHLVLGYYRSLEEKNKKNGGSEGTISFHLREGELSEVTTFLQMHQMKYAYQYFLGFLKPLEHWRDEVLQSNYEENEWRYIVPETKDIPWLWGEKAYLEWRGTGAKPAPSDALKNKGLSFDVTDITFILVPTDKEKYELIESLIKDDDFMVCNQRITIDQKYYLVSKIQSIESISRTF